MMNLAERQERCYELKERYFSDLPPREWFMDQAVHAVLKPTDRLLDAGSGSTLALLNQYGLDTSFAVGIDVVTPTHDPVAKAAVTIGDLAALPFRDGSFDLVVSRSVVEHLEQPVAVFRELARTVRPGGRVIFTTPNKYYYSSIVAALVPYSWKDLYMKTVFGEDGYDHFPVMYRANTKGSLRRIAADAGFTVERLDALRHFPFYFLFSPILFRLGVVYDRVVTRLRLDGLQSTWLVVLRRS